MKLQNMILIFLAGEFVKNGISFNPLLTYTVRFQKIIFIPNMTGNYTINQYKESQYVNVDFQINSNESLNKLILTFYRCNQEGINCEYFQSWMMPDFCKQLKEKNQIWSIAINSLTPRFECPIDNVNFKLVNGTFDIRLALALYPEFTDYSWRVKLQYYVDDTFAGGMTIAVSTFGYRKKNKSILRN